MNDHLSYDVRSDSVRAGYIIDARIAWWRIQFRQPALVVTVTGELDASNTSCFTKQLRRLALVPSPIVLDMLEVEFVGVDAMRALFYFHDQRRQAALPWVLVAGKALRRLMQIGDVDGEIPQARSTDRALDEIPSPATL